MNAQGALLISAGMPRAGSGWYYNLMHDLVVAAGGCDARVIRREYHLSWLLTEVNCNLSTLSFWRMIPVLLPVFNGQRFAIKTHAGPTKLVEWLVRREKMFIAYIYRDPRAALLSAYEYGNKARAKNRSNAFSQLSTIDEAVKFYTRYIAIWEAWRKVPGVLMTRYEDLVEDYEREVARLAEFMAVNLDMSAVKDVVEQYNPDRGSTLIKGIHFSHGKAERFREALTPEQLEKVTRAFGSSLARMGYF